MQIAQSMPVAFLTFALLSSHRKAPTLAQSTLHFRTCSTLNLSVFDTAESSWNSLLSLASRPLLVAYSSSIFSLSVPRSSPVLTVASFLLTLHPLPSKTPVFPNGNIIGILSGTIHCLGLPFYFRTFSILVPSHTCQQCHTQSLWQQKTTHIFQNAPSRGSTTHSVWEILCHFTIPSPNISPML